MLHALYFQANRQLLAGHLGFNRISELVVEHTARLVDMQLSAMGAYARIGLDQLRALNSLSGPLSLEHYLQTQQQLLQATAGLWSQDVDRLSGLGRQFRDDVSAAAEENVISMAEFLERTGREGA